MSKSYTGHIVINGPRNAIGRVTEIAHIYYDRSGELAEIQIYNELIDDWSAIDLLKMGESFQEKIRDLIDSDIKNSEENEDFIYQNYADLKRG
jgi:hypothetical protein